MKDRSQLHNLPGHLVQACQLLPGTGQDPLHPLGSPQCVEEHQVLCHSVWGEHNSYRTNHLVVQAEHVPPGVSWLDLQQPHIKPLQDLLLFILSVCPPDSSLQDTSQIVWVQLGGWLTQLTLQQVQEEPHDVALPQQHVFPQCPHVIHELELAEHEEIPAECGMTRAGSNRIVNGRPAKRNAWPWLAAVGYTDPSTGKVLYLCGATLITNKHVVTAAHCVRDDMVTVLLGEHVLGNDTDGVNPEEYNVTRMIKHENYNSRTFENDIAIVEFDTEVTFKKGIQPACLPSITPALLNDSFVSEGVIIAGWGATSFRGPTSNILLQGLISVVTNQECKEKFSQFNNVDIGDTKICARDKNDRIDACQGDSGGPMVVLKKSVDNRFRYHLIGVVSFGYRCAVKGFPGVYTRVTEYDQWIRNTVNT